jgi:dTDP-4-dehydrorhamnose reductase
MMKFLVLGSSGMAGHTIALYLLERGYDVVGFSRRPNPIVPGVLGDATDDQCIKDNLTVGKYDVVINAIGILNKAADANKSLSIRLNSYLPHLLADTTRNTKTRIFHMSTDCVFAGNTGPYSEASLQDGAKFYDRSKALGELDDDKNLTFRNSIVGPDMNPRGIGLLNWFMQQDGPINGYTKAIWTGLTTLELAKAMESAAQEDAVGLVNMVPAEPISKYDLLCLFNKYLCNESVRIIPDDSVDLDKTLLRSRQVTSFRPSDYETQIADLASWIGLHRSLYPQYRLD